jgi:hypothetical protein
MFKRIQNSRGPMIAARLDMRSVAFAIAVLLCLPEGTVLAQERTAQRIEGPTPDGQGGTLIVSIDQILCGQADLIFSVRREDREGGGPLWHVFEAPVVKPCSWTITDLWPGKYDAMLRRESPKQVAAWREFAIEAGTSTFQTLDPSRTEITGTITIDGAPAWNLAGLPIHFTSPNRPAVWVETMIDQRGEYRASLDMSGEVWMSIGADKALMSVQRTLAIEPGLNVVNVDLPEGVINVTIVPPPGLSREFRVLTAVVREAPAEKPQQYPGMAGTHRQPEMDATRTYAIIGQGLGRYVIRAGTDSVDTSSSKVLAEVVVTLTPDEPRKDVVLEIPKLPPPIPRRHLNIEGCPPPRTAACVEGRATQQ